MSFIFTSGKHLIKDRAKIKQEDREGPWSITWEIDQTVKVEPLVTSKAQFEKKGQFNLNNYYTLSPRKFLCKNYFKIEPMA
jgi:hypothetical protein